MLAGMSLGTELKRFSKGAMPRIAILTIVLMPLLYGAMYLWVFWNPFDEVAKVPVAIVNQDRPVEANGQELNAGKQVRDELLASGELDLHATDAKEAAAGLASGKYYFTIEIPKDFSSSIASATTDDPHKAQIQFTFNDANNYLAGIIGQTAASRVTQALNDNIGERAVDQVLVGLTSAGKGLKKAADGSQQLADGLKQADDGAQQLAAGSNELATNMVTARDGSAQLADGTTQLATGINAATTPLLSLLTTVDSSGIKPSQYAADAAAISSDLSDVLGVIGAAGAGQSQAEQAVSQVIAGLRNSADPNARALANALAPVKQFLQTQGLNAATTAKVDRLAKQSNTLAAQLGDRNSSLRSTLAMLESGELTGKVVELRNGADQLQAGAAQLHDGLIQLSDGSNRLAAGADQLAQGTPQLLDGADQLATGLADGVKQIPDFGDDEQRQKTAANLSQPVALSSYTHNPAPTFGTGFAPFFLPLAMFIGAIIIWMMLKPLQSRPVIGGLGGLRSVLASYWPGVLISVAQVVVMFVVAHFAVGLDAVHPLGMLGFMLLVSATFLALIQMFNAVLGPAVGRVVSLAFLMVQIVASGGIYPVETTAKPAQWFHPFDPMSYAVTGLRQLISGGVDSRLWVAVGVLAAIAVVSLAISAWAARRNRQYTMVQLFPPIQV
ncbi:YhgE/Pip domain-containing protein [Gordonia sp. (in: high G+C Gram-positive bacteria)]|uniref:YhgE/Pip domain-containing protein n=1 Tax=Gordonia sp. (in: high G+C Gram-positive bacteria) TaxID=84139 RepID=UPI0016AFEDE8|nr:YhgE/Pip domain-containing protein [Gordonia sp. (in: high G+C Gram-positive bacteria)]NLG45656.1 YhgE/Pip domain-containing protein [Gordonia sp. (in: high G+C Gram-positive bacteria)]